MIAPIMAGPLPHRLPLSTDDGGSIYDHWSMTRRCDPFKWNGAPSSVDHAKALLRQFYRRSGMGYLFGCS
jgi:hypothetical protein